jgi:hypothetical protein
VQRKLADYQYLTVNVEYGFIHNAILVVKNTQVDNLFTQPVDVFLAVRLLYAYQYHKSFADGGLTGSVDCDRRMPGTLYNYSHVLVLKNNFAGCKVTNKFVIAAVWGKNLY